MLMGKSKFGIPHVTLNENIFGIMQKSPIVLKLSVVNCKKSPPQKKKYLNK